MAVVTRNVQSEPNAPARVVRVIELFDQEDVDAKAIAKKLGFKNHRDLGRFMKIHGYVWSTEQGNYVWEQQKSQNEEADNQVPSEDTTTNTNDVGEPSDSTLSLHPTAASVEAYLPLLQYLAMHHERLQSLIEGHTASTPGAVPRYTIPGVFVTKSVHMSHDLDRLVRNFSKERNISQREIFEVALIDFFRRYGYGREVQVLLSET